MVQSRQQLGQIMRSCRRHPDQIVGLVPTMGALHAGHLSLVEASTSQCDVTVVTIFVNPAQFGPNEDLSLYPQRFQEDLTALSDYPVEIVFAPTQEEMYPPGFSTHMDPPQVAHALEGHFRPNHFQGVATIVLKLFHLIPADISFFGQKDYQQSLVIRHMIRDLDLPMRVVVCPTVRDGDGAAELFVFDPEARTFTDRLAPGYGRPLDLGLQNGPDGGIYGFTSSCIYRLDPKTLEVEEGVREEDGFDVAGPILGTDVYFATGCRLRAVRLF